MEERFKTFTVFMTGIRRSIQKIKTEEMAEYNLKSPHVSCLYYLYKYGAMTATKLCGICDEDKAAVSRSIVQLENAGYVKCMSSAKKRYRAYIELTPKGMRIAESVARKVDRILVIAGRGLTEEDRMVMYRSLAIIRNNLDELCKRYNK